MGFMKLKVFIVDCGGRPVYYENGDTNSPTITVNFYDTNTVGQVIQVLKQGHLRCYLDRELKFYKTNPTIQNGYQKWFDESTPLSECGIVGGQRALYVIAAGEDLIRMMGTRCRPGLPPIYYR
ncbi:hypothetical protein GGI16_003985 [Coemansia sp. S142-1]|nr:hypothetical protein GGI16_003985 [Coemansia sp. S142-1]